MILNLSDTTVQVIDEILQQTNISLTHPNIVIIGTAITEFRQEIESARNNPITIPSTEKESVNGNED